MGRPGPLPPRICEPFERLPELLHKGEVATGCFTPECVVTTFCVEREYRAVGVWTVWGAEYFGDGKTLDTHVKRLRKKIEVSPRQPVHLVVVRGMGYRFLEREQQGS